VTVSKEKISHFMDVKYSLPLNLWQPSSACYN
jgi:hypothetical protein